MPILIITTEEDQSTSDVIDWLLFKKKKVIRINHKKQISTTINVSQLDELSIIHAGKKINLSQITSYWYRRGNFTFYNFLDSNNSKTKESELLNHHLYLENSALAEYINLALEDKPGIGSASKANVNKLAVLSKAQALGLDIPSTLITSRKDEVILFIERYGRIVCKPISNGIDAGYKNGSAQIFTEEWNLERINELSECFALSLFQELIDKKLELRVFFLNNEFYAMASIPTNRQTASIDIRKDSFQAVDRFVPFNIPLEIKNKLLLLMHELNLISGSLDIALTFDNKYVMFEVNPIGQYNANSEYCNYKLDKMIATFLTQ